MSILMHYCGLFERRHTLKQDMKPNTKSLLATTLFMKSHRKWLILDFQVCLEQWDGPEQKMACFLISRGSKPPGAVSPIPKIKPNPPTVVLIHFPFALIPHQTKQRLEDLLQIRKMASNTIFTLSLWKTLNCALTFQCECLINYISKTAVTVLCFGTHVVLDYL